MRDLVPLAAILIDMAGGAERAKLWARAVADKGEAGLSTTELTPDERIYITREARRLAVLGPSGAPRSDRAIELCLVLELITALPPPHKPMPPHEPLVFTLPAYLQSELTPPERLDVLVMDVIRSAVREVRIGGPFWSREGMEILREVLEPAVEVRGVKCVFYAHRQGDQHDRVIGQFVRDLRGLGPVELWWYKSRDQSLLHAKFCLADQDSGYFGTANLTSLGLAEHVEIGVRLSHRQCAELIRVLNLLERGGLLEKDT